MSDRYRPTPADYKMVFEDHRVGAAILEDMILLFSKPAVLEGGIDAAIKTYHRLGERAVVDHIVRQINLANSVPVDNPPEDDHA